MKHVITYAAALLLTACASGAAQAGPKPAAGPTAGKPVLDQEEAWFEFAFLGVLLIASETTRGFFPLWSILIANLLAAVAMLAFLWRNHPRIRRAMGRAPLGAPDFANE